MSYKSRRGFQCSKVIVEIDVNVVFLKIENNYSKGKFCYQVLMQNLIRDIMENCIVRIFNLENITKSI